MTKEQKFYKALQDIFIGAKIEGEGGFINLMRIKAGYYSQIEKLLKEDINKAVAKYPAFREELFDKLHTFFNRYFTESGSIYFNSTPFHNNIYEKVYTDEKDVILFWKTQMLYYVKTDRIFRSMPVEFDGLKFYFDASQIESKKANEKRALYFEIKQVREDETVVFIVKYSERGTKTKSDEILKDLKRKNIKITEELLEKAFRIFEKQSEVDFFINKNANAFLQEQFKLWSYQYFWEGAKEWSGDRVNQLQILKNIAFKVIDFISQFEDELVKVWNKPKFARRSNYVITLDRITDKKIIGKILKHNGFKDQIKEWQKLGIVDSKFKIKDVEDKEYGHLPIDTKYFKDLELEILSLFDDLDNQLDGWLIKSENYQALNTILPKFKEKVQTIYIDPPFNLGQGADFDYEVNYKDSNWATLLENRLRLASSLLSNTGSIFVRCDHNGNFIVRCLLNDIFGEDCFLNEIIIAKTKEFFKTMTNLNKFGQETESLFFYSKTLNNYFKNIYKIKSKPVEYEPYFPTEDKNYSDFRIINNRKYFSPKGRKWGIKQEHIQGLIDNKNLILRDNKWILIRTEEIIKNNWTEFQGYSRMTGFATENAEEILKRCVESTGDKESLTLDFFAGSATTQAVSQKLRRKWIGVEMGAQFFEAELPRLKNVIYGKQDGISKDLGEKYQGGGFFKYYELEQYEDALKNCKYGNGDLFSKTSDKAYQDYVFMKDEKMLSALEIDYKNKKTKVDLNNLYPDIDIAETLSNLTGKWIKAIRDGEVEFTDGSKINTKELDYRLIKPLIWWE